MARGKRKARSRMASSKVFTLPLLSGFNLTFCMDETEEAKNVTTQRKIIRNRMGLLKLAEELKSVSKACKLMGYSRDRFIASRSRTSKGRSRVAGGHLTHPVLKNRGRSGDRGGGNELCAGTTRLWAVATSHAA
jgi:hypothetical protein